MPKLDFSRINHSSAESFKAQRKLIKNLAKGATALCKTCQKPLKLTTPKASDKDITTGISCAKGCTDIQLEFAN